jgi:hypothetical protein
MLGRRKKRRGGERPDAGQEMYQGLRSLALRSVSDGLPSPPAQHPDVSGLVVDMTASGGYATLVALTDNTTSMYTSGGGGTIGAGERPQIAEATHRLLAVVQAHLGLFGSPEDQGLPSPGQVRFHVLTPAGSHSVDIPDDCFWGRADHELEPVIAGVQAIVTALREDSPR